MLLVDRKRGRLTNEKILANARRFSDKDLANAPIEGIFLKRTTDIVAIIKTETSANEKTNCSLAETHSERKKAVNTKFLRIKGLFGLSTSRRVFTKYFMPRGSRTNEKALMSEAK
jgi:hypothetical protein